MTSHHLRLLPVMWGTIGLALFGSLIVAVVGLDPAIAGYIAGALLVACLFTCVVAYLLDSRAMPDNPWLHRTDDSDHLTGAT